MAPIRIPPPNKKPKEAPPPREQTLENLDKTTASETETLTFRVSPEFKRKFKGYAVSQGMSMVDLLKKGYDLAKMHYGS